MKNKAVLIIPAIMVISGLTLVLAGCSDFGCPRGGGSTTGITWTATTTGSPTTAIDFTFSAAPPAGLVATDFVIFSGSGSATRGNLSATGTLTRRLTVSNVSAGTVSISINRSGIASGSQTVTLMGSGVATGTRNITVQMFDSHGDGWTGNSLRINVNGVNRATNPTVSSGSNSTYTFNANVGDVIRVYWISGNHPGDCAFAIFYTNNPPSPAFNPVAGATNNTARLLVHRLYGSLSGITTGALLGSFTVAGS